MKLMITKNIVLSLRSVRASRGRSILTVFGIGVAVTAVTLMFGIGQGVKRSLATQANAYGQNVVTVRPTQLAANQGFLASLSAGTASTTLTQDDLGAISNLKSVRQAVPLSIAGSSAKGDRTTAAAIIATNSDLSGVINQKLAFGSFFTDKDSANNLAVLGAGAASRLFEQPAPLGRSFTVHGQEYIVAGILDSFATPLLSSGLDLNQAVFITGPNSDGTVPNLPIYQILAESSDTATAARDIRSALARNHQTDSDFNVLTPDQLSKADTDSFNTLTTLTVAAALLILLVSGVGILNVMLVAVTERIHEIGIRKAVGATNRQILDQFLTEAATLCVIGSLAGFIIAMLATWLLRVFTTIDPAYAWVAGGLSCAVASVFGLLCGTIPAIKAARKDPIAALRSE